MAEGPPERVAAVARSHTGRFLAQMLGVTPGEPVPAPDSASAAAPSTDGARRPGRPRKAAK